MDFVKKYCDMIIEVATDLKKEKRSVSESIDLINQFTRNMESFKNQKSK